MPYHPPPHGYRTFLITWATQSVSVFGSALTLFASTIWLTQTLYPRPEQRADLALALSAVSLAVMLPSLLTAPIAGAWADRHDRRRTMMFTDVLSGCISLLVAGLMALQWMQLWLLVLIVCIHSIVSAFHQSAFDTSYAMLVPEHLLPRANGMMQTMWALSSILSPAIAATLISLPGLVRQMGLGGSLLATVGVLQDGVPLAIFLDALTFYFAATTLVPLHIPSPRRTDLAQNKSLWADVKEGATFIWCRRPMLWLLGTFTVSNLLITPITILQPLVVKFNLAADWQARGFTFESALALLTTAGAFGGLAGGLFVSVWGGLKRRRVYGVVAPMIASGLAMIAVGLSSYILLTMALAFALTATFPVANVHSQAIWQIQTPRELQGRVFAVRRLIAQCTGPLGLLLAGLAGGLFDPGTVVSTMGAVLVAFSVAQMFNPSLLRVEDNVAMDKLAAAYQAKKQSLNSAQ